MGGQYGLTTETVTETVTNEPSTKEIEAMNEMEPETVLVETSVYPNDFSFEWKRIQASLPADATEEQIKAALNTAIRQKLFIEHHRDMQQREMQKARNKNRKRTGKNSLCSCGSGRKRKKCCG